MIPKECKRLPRWTCLGAQASSLPTKDKAGLFLRMRCQGADRDGMERAI